MGSWGLSGWCLRVPPTSLGSWGTGDAPHLPSKCPWQKFPQQPRKTGHQTAGGGRGPGLRARLPSAPRAVYWHPERCASGWFGRGGACGPPAPVAARPLILDLRLCTSESLRARCQPIEPNFRAAAIARVLGTTYRLLVHVEKASGKRCLSGTGFVTAALFVYPAQRKGEGA